ncbi:MAG TPA: penicillin-binding transpeptidase domain-containing protein [Actinomycetota bacterium]|nr:penicillin-binding transpeptidase domain-containing protein [Actinomycetota bacterium]
MNKQIRVVGFTMLALFGLVFVNLSWLQLVRAESLANHPSNTRLLLKEYALERGAIRSVNGDTLAISEPTPDSELKSIRRYPKAELFAHLTGYYSIRYGRERLERSYNRHLTGEGGVVTMQDLGDRLLGKGKKGDTLVLSIDTAVQQAADDALGGRKGAIVALDPVSGQILAMVSKPSFDPNGLSQHSAQGQQDIWVALNEDEENRPLVHRAARSTYPPGSTFKVITVAAALENGIGPDTSFPASSGYQPPQTDRVIRNFGGGTCGGDMRDALRVSCNTYFARLAAEMPAGILQETAAAFGFTETPPLDISAVASRMPDDDDLRSPAFRALSSIGQYSVAATPLQMALVAAGIANGGNVPEPKLVKQIEDARGSVVQQTSPKIWKRAVSASTASTIKDMMVDVAANGTARAAALPGVQVAAKTGTAQTGATGDDSIAWTIAFAPADSPRIAIAVMVEGSGPGSDETGGRVASPMVRQVLQAHRSVAGW